ncbi:hypothetical protein LshimejAT787_2600510 [Lyophyllum shimeji]|uniref:Uncharacterized protein n=1 Tax=Lyophyllum shimeji TaxID=47721 RepID=A0A9P3Q148_LYOSH|nr:hypothetical protein LshimejAT787_2600510 [Lyophyllum shimeji]
MLENLDFRFLSQAQGTLSLLKGHRFIASAKCCSPSFRCCRRACRVPDPIQVRSCRSDDSHERVYRSTAAAPALALCDIAQMRTQTNFDSED